MSRSQVSAAAVECVSGPALLGECPLWSEREAKLYWIDIDGRAIHRYDPATGGSALSETSCSRTYQPR